MKTTATKRESEPTKRTAASSATVKKTSSKTKNTSQSAETTSTISSNSNLTEASCGSVKIEGASAEKRIGPKQISERAYELWLGRGCVHGFHVDDWLEAEKQLAQEAPSEGN